MSESARQPSRTRVEPEQSGPAGVMDATLDIPCSGPAPAETAVPLSETRTPDGAVVGRDSGPVNLPASIQPHPEEDAVDSAAETRVPAPAPEGSTLAGPSAVPAVVPERT